MTQPAQTDEQLVLRFRQGHTDAFERLVERYRRELFHFLVRFLGNRGIAEDAFQETFLQVYVSIDTFDTDRRFKPWLFTIASNKARDLIRRNKRKGAVLLSEPLDTEGDQTLSVVDLMESDVPLPDAQVQDGELQELVQQVVESLPAHLKEILLLAYFQQCPYKQIAQMLHIPLGTVKSRLHSAVATFAQVWKRRVEPDQS